MPELPEVETVRAGLARHVVGRTVTAVEVRRASTVRRHDGGMQAFADALTGRVLTAAVRRGKFLWLPLGDAAQQGASDAAQQGARDAARAAAQQGVALLAHLGMSGQMLVRAAGAPGVPDDPHLRARLHLSGGAALDFVDQRTFGYLSVCPLVPTPDGAPGGRGSDLPALPASAAHIARDLLDPYVRRDALVVAVRRRRTGIKRALLDQTLVSGVGNIYADEALWRARVHGASATDTMRASRVRGVLDAAEEVMSEAVAAGGTSFDRLYVDVDGASGWFERSLAVYGRAGQACPRCGTTVRREAFMNRSSYRCPQCQPAPRAGRRSSSSRRTA